MGDLVYTKDFTTTPITWIPGKVAKLTGPLSYLVTLQDGHVVCRHVDALRNRKVLYPIPKPSQSPEPDDSGNDLYLPDIPAATPTPTTPAAAPVQPDLAAVQPDLAIDIASLLTDWVGRLHK